MKLLVVSISAPPKNSPESVQTGRYLQFLARIHDVTLLTTRVTGGWAPEDPGLAKFLEGVRRIELSVYPYRVMRLLKKVFPLMVLPDEEVDFTWRADEAASRVGQRPDIIFSRSAPFSSAMMAYKLARRWKCPWIFHLSDPWFNNPFHNPTAKENEKHARLERECVELASAVTFTSHKTIEFYGGRYPEMRSKFFFLPNVLDPSTMNDDKPSFSGKFRIVFTGRLYRSRSIHQFMDVFKSAMEKWPLLLNECELILAGFFDDFNVDLVRDVKLRNVSYIGPISLDKSIELQRSATMLLLIDSLGEDSRYDLFFPSKILDYMAANRPIIAFTRNSSTTNNLIQGKLGQCFSNESMHEFPQYLRHMVDSFVRKDEEKFVIDQNVRGSFSAAVNAERLNEIIKQVANGS